MYDTSKVCRKIKNQGIKVFSGMQIPGLDTWNLWSIKDFFVVDFFQSPKVLINHISVF